MSLEAIIAAVVALIGGGGAGALIRGYWEHRRNMGRDKESDRQQVIAVLLERVGHLEREHDSCMERNREFAQRVGSLEAKNEALVKEVHTIREALARVEGATAVKATIVANDSGIVEEWSPGAAMMFGWTDAEALGHSVEFIMPGYLQGRHRAAYARAVASPDETVNVTIRDAFATDKSGMTFPVTITVSSFQKSGHRMFKADILRRVLI